MAYKCRICNSNEVDTPGGICDMCALTQDPYVAAMTGGSRDCSNTDVEAQQAQTDVSDDVAYRRRGKSRRVLIGNGNALDQTNAYGNEITTSGDEEQNVKVYHAGSVPEVAGAQPDMTAAAPATSNKGPLTTGIIKNISNDTDDSSMLVKIFAALFKGVPLCFDNNITMFQVFPDFSGTSLNAQGNACDQVIVYGKITSGIIAENNDVEVYGYRDRKNNIVAKSIKNTASGTTITPNKMISATVVRLLVLAVLVVLAVICATVGLEGIIIGIVVIICLTNLPLVFKIASAVFGGLFMMLRRIFR